jgi:hypothetical protein
MFQTKAVEKIKTHIFLLSNFLYFFFENRALCAMIMWNSMLGPDTPLVTLWRMRISCWIIKATNKHSEYLILITCPLQHRLHECASVSRVYVHWLSRSCNYKLSNPHLPADTVKYFAIHCFLNSTVSCAVRHISLTPVGCNVCGELMEVL